MEDLSDIRSLPLSSLAITTSRLLSNLLDSTKVLRTEGPIKRHRDWRGLASLVNISSELEATIWNCSDKTGKVLELWMQSRPAVVGELLEHLIALDRFDVYDDIIASIRENQQRPGNQVALQNNKHYQYNNNNIQYNNNNQIAIVDDNDLITFEDRPGHRHKYDAFVLHAKEDMVFVMELKRILNTHGFELCTRDNLLPGYASQFPPVSRLISEERCNRIILVYSPEFLQCHDTSFFRDYAQALSIRLNRRMMLPIMYRKCELPPHLSIYWQLYYNEDDLESFWSRLVRSMEITRVNMPMPAPQVTQQQYSSSLSSAVNIHTMSDSVPDNYSRFFLPPKTTPNRCLTPSNVPVSPSNVTVAPSNVTVAPSNVSVAPSKVPVSPSNVTVTPSNVSVAPSDVTVAPSNVTVAPSNVTVAPSNVSLSPGDVSLATSNISLATSNVSLATSTLSLTQSIPTQMNTTDMLIKPTKKKRGFIKKFSRIFNKGKRNEKKIVDTMKPSLAEQLCA